MPERCGGTGNIKKWKWNAKSSLMFAYVRVSSLKAVEKRRDCAALWPVGGVGVKKNGEESWLAPGPPFGPVSLLIPLIERISCRQVPF
jgi:hypothetical protein